MSGEHARSRATRGRQRPTTDATSSLRWAPMIDDRRPPERTIGLDERSASHDAAADHRARGAQLRRLSRRPAARADAGARRHLHAFVSEVGLTGEEWERAIAALTRERRDHRRAPSGVRAVVRRARSSRCSSTRSRTPGAGRGGAESTRARARYVPGRVAVLGPTSRRPARVRRVDRGGPRPLGPRPRARTDGEPIAGAELDVWQNGHDRLYAVQRPEAPEITCAVASRPGPTAASASSRCARSRIRSRMTARSARCCGRPAGTRGGRPTST